MAIREIIMKENYRHTLTTMESLNHHYPCILFQNESWNGFAIPYVTKEVRNQIAAEFRRLGRDGNLVEEYEDIIEDYLSDDFVEIDGKQYTNVGIGLCWSESEPWEIAQDNITKLFSDYKGNMLTLQQLNHKGA